MDPDWRHVWDDALALWGTELKLIVTGPCTNLAAWVKWRNMTTSRFGSVTVMGGAMLYKGNTTPTAEWNFWVDPHAAKEAFAAASHSYPIAADLPEMLRFYFEFHQAEGSGYQVQIHDLLTCMVALDTVEYCTTETTIDVEADSELTRDTSVVDLGNHWHRPTNARLVTDADIDAAHAELLAAAETLAQAAA